MPEMYQRDTGSIWRVEDRAWGLDERSFSLVFDSGLYWAEVLRAQVPQLKWTLCVEEDNADYHQPVVKGEQLLFVNPIGLTHVFALQIAEHRAAPGRLGDLLVRWREALSPKVSVR